VTVLVVAHLLEAKALIAHFKLKKTTDQPFAIYQNDTILLIISGMGVLKSSIATTYILSKTDNIKHIYNIGIAGCTDEAVPLGSLFLVNKIRFASHSHYPDILLTHSLQEASLASLLEPASKEERDIIDTKLVDMEAIGFFEASVRFVSLSKISIIKVVSDHLLDSKNEKFAKDFVLNLFEQNIEKLADFMTHYMIKNKPLLSVKEQGEIEQISKEHSLSFTKKQQFLQHIQYSKLHLKISTVNKTFIEQEIKSFTK